MSAKSLSFSKEIPKTLDRKGFDEISWQDLDNKSIRLKSLLPEDCKNPFIFLNGDWSKAASTDCL